MSTGKVLLVGAEAGGENASDGSGACIARTVRFREALSGAGFDTVVCAPGAHLSGRKLIRRELLRNQFRCMVAISPHPAELAARSGSGLPLWIDMNGMHPAEINLTTDMAGNPRLPMLRFLALENSLLTRGDYFSAPSKRQAYALLGELFLIGRIGHESRFSLPVTAIPHCSMPAPKADPEAVFNGSFTVISTGSFNSWFDSETLFRALIHAMGKAPELVFVCTGGALHFTRDKYAAFLKMIRGSGFEDRFHMKGWVSREELEKVQHAASAAIYTDIASGETTLGARTRALDWISRGIPVVCTRGAEISEDIAMNNLGIVVEQGDWEALGNALLELHRDPALRQSIRTAQERWSTGPNSPEQLFDPLLKWCEEPKRLSEFILGRPTVPEFSSPAYNFRLVTEVCRKKGVGGVLKALLRKIR